MDADVKRTPAEIAETIDQIAEELERKQMECGNAPTLERLLGSKVNDLHNAAEEVRALAGMDEGDHEDRPERDEGYHEDKPERPGCTHPMALDKHGIGCPDCLAMPGWEHQDGCSMA